jgi:hypothetical protein
MTADNKRWAGIAAAIKVDALICCGRESCGDGYHWCGDYYAIFTKKRDGRLEYCGFKHAECLNARPFTSRHNPTINTTRITMTNLIIKTDSRPPGEDYADFSTGIQKSINRDRKCRRRITTRALGRCKPMEAQ